MCVYKNGILYKIVYEARGVTVFQESKYYRLSIARHNSTLVSYCPAYCHIVTALHTATQCGDGLI